MSKASRECGKIPTRWRTRSSRRAFFDTMKRLLIFSLLIFFTACANAAPTATRIPSTATLISPTQNIAPTNTRAQNTATLPAPTASQIPPPTTTVPPTATQTKIPAATKSIASSALAPISELSAQTRAGWEEFVASVSSEANAQTRVDELWNELLKMKRVPLALQDGAVFLYKGDAASVAWRGDFSYWQLGKPIEGVRVGQTDLWYGVAKFPRDSRTEYEIFLNDARAIPDPANPRKHKGGFGYNSIFAMPEFQVTDFSTPRAEIPHGALTDWLTLESEAWGAPLNYRVYTPPNYDALENLPVLYITDGNDYSDPEMGGTPTILDNLIADGKIAPLLAVFIDARNPQNVRDNQREKQFLARPEDFAEFIATELVPHIDTNYRTDTSRQGRTLVGVSYGGVFTTYAGLRYQDVFGNLGIFSPAYWVFQSQVGAGVPHMTDFVNKTLAARGTMPSKIFLSAGLGGWDVGNMTPWAKRFEQHGDSVQLFHSQEGHSWSAWSGLTDELLEYFFGRAG